MSDSRNQRRQAVKFGQNVAAGLTDWAEKVMVFCIGEMMQRGPGILANVRNGLPKDADGAINSGYAVDAMMNAALAMESAALHRDAKAYVEALIEVLFLARDVAVREGKIQHKPMAEA